MTIQNPFKPLSLICLVSGLGILFGLVACNSRAGGGGQEPVIKLSGAPLTFRPPEGFKAMGTDEISEYPPRPSMHFRLPKWTHEQAGWPPQLWIQQTPTPEAYGAKTLDQYLNKRLVPVPLATTLTNITDISVGGKRAVEYGVVSPVMDGGGSEVFYAIYFEHDGMIYECGMTADPDDYKQYVSIFEDFCSSVHFGK